MSQVPRVCPAGSLGGFLSLENLFLMLSKQTEHWISALITPARCSAEIFSLPSAACVPTKEHNLLWGSVILSSLLGHSVMHCDFKWVSSKWGD